MKKVARIALLCLLASMLLACLAIAVYRSGSNRTVEQFKAELTARGEKWKISEIALPPSTNAAEIAARQILQSKASTSNPRLVVDLMKYVAPGTARIAWRGGLELVSSTGATRSPGPDWEEFVSQTKNTEPTLKILRVAMENPPPDTGWVWRDDYQNITNWPPNPPGRTFVRDRAFCQTLYNAVIADLHETNLDAAVANLHALVGLAQMNRNELPLVCPMIRIAIAQAGLSATWEALQAPGWDEPRLASLQTEWEGVDFIGHLDRSFEAERAMGELMFAKVRGSSLRELVQFIGQSRLIGKSAWTSSGSAQQNPMGAVWNRVWAGYLLPIRYKLTGINEDELAQLRFMTKIVDNVGLLKQGKSWTAVEPGLTNLQDEILETFDKASDSRFFVSRMTIPSFQRALLTEVRADTLRRLAITAIAIKRYQLKHNLAPPDLNALVPEFLSSVPIDPMSGKPLCYRLNADGSFTLYSTGEDGKDDGGDPTPVQVGEDPGLWNCRDAVWPTAASAEEESAWEAKIQDKQSAAKPH